MLISFSIGNYKSYYEDCLFEFAQPGPESLGLTLLVGRNNSGKSSILNILSSICSSAPNITFDKLDRHHNKDPKMTLRYNLQGVEQLISINKLAKAYYDKQSTLNTGQVVEFATLTNHDRPLLAYVPSRRPWDDTFHSQAVGRDLKAFESAREALSLQTQGARQLERLGDQLNAIIHAGEKEQFDELLKSILPDFSDWTTDRVSGQDRIMYISASGLEHAIRDVGDGVGSVFRLCYALHRYPKDVPLLLDEPELSLHPEGQRRLYNVIREQAKSRQIIMATHSPHSVHWPDLIGGVRLYRIAQEEDGHSRAYLASNKSLKDVHAVAYQDKKNRKLFDYLGKEIFFTSGALFLEGQEDVHIISNFLDEEKGAELPIFAYGAGGAPHILKWIRLAREIGVTVAALYDGDQAEAAKDAAAEFENDPNVLIITSPYDDIRDKFENSELKKSGFFTKDWVIREDRKDKLLDILSRFSEHLRISKSASDSRSIISDNILQFPG